MEAKLQALKVVDLKKLLQDANLPSSGAKADLIKRLLENPDAAASVNAGDEQEEDLLAEAKEPEPVSAVADAAPAELEASTSAPSAAEAAPSSSNGHAATASSAVEESTEAIPAKDEATVRAETIAELEKRKARAQRWGLPTQEIDDALQQVKDNGTSVTESKVSLSNLDGALQTKGRKELKQEKRAAQKQAQQEKRKGGDGAETGKRQTEKPKEAKEVAQPVDPVEEEKKRKRMERFGLGGQSESSEKKIKT